jgi:hypothetical protein
MMARTRLDHEVLELLADEPELLAIADAVAETQRPRRRVRPAGVAAGIALVAAAVIAFAFWSGGGSNGISGNTAYAAIGGASRMLQISVVADERHVTLTYDRGHEQLTAATRGRRVGVPATALPPQATALPPSFGGRFAGVDIGPVVSLLSEYPGLARAGDLQPVARPPRGDRSLRWVSYRSSLGYVVEVGLAEPLLRPVEVERSGASAPIKVLQLATSN